MFGPQPPCDRRTNPQLAAKWLPTPPQPHFCCPAGPGSAWQHSKFVAKTESNCRFIKYVHVCAYVDCSKRPKATPSIKYPFWHSRSLQVRVIHCYLILKHLAQAFTFFGDFIPLHALVLCTRSVVDKNNSAGSVAPLKKHRSSSFFLALAMLAAFFEFGTAAITQKSLCSTKAPIAPMAAPSISTRTTNWSKESTPIAPVVKIAPAPLGCYLPWCQMPLAAKYAKHWMSILSSTSGPPVTLKPVSGSSTPEMGCAPFPALSREGLIPMHKATKHSGPFRYENSRHMEFARACASFKGSESSVGQPDLIQAYKEAKSLIYIYIYILYMDVVLYINVKYALLYIIYIYTWNILA